MARLDYLPVLWTYYQTLGRWPGSKKEMQQLSQRFSSTEDLADHLKRNGRRGKGGEQAAPTWLVGALGPELGAKANYLRIPGMAQVIVRAGAEGWSPDKTNAAIESTRWWRTHTEQQRVWLLASKADRTRLVENTKISLADQWRSIFGVSRDPDDFTAWAGRVASGALSAQMWGQQVRESDEYEARFPGQAARRRAGLSELPEDRYRQMEEDARSVARQYLGAAADTLTPQHFTGMFANDVLPDELAKRHEFWNQVERVLGPQARSVFLQGTGTDVNQSDLYGFFTGLRPDLTNAYTTTTGTPPPVLSLRALQEAADRTKRYQESIFNAGGGVKSGLTRAEATF